MSDSFVVVRKPQGAAGVALALSQAVAHGEITSEAASTITQAARLQSGTIDDNAVDVLEKLGRQVGDLAASLRRTRDAEAIPSIKLASYPLTRQDLAKIAVAKNPHDDFGPENLWEAVVNVVGQVEPLGPVNPGVRGAKLNAAGGYDVVVAMHSWQEEPKDSDTHYLVSIGADGSNGKLSRVKVAL